VSPLGGAALSARVTSSRACQQPSERCTASIASPDPVLGTGRRCRAAHWRECRDRSGRDSLATPSLPTRRHLSGHPSGRRWPGQVRATGLTSVRAHPRRRGRRSNRSRGSRACRQRRAPNLVLVKFAARRVVHPGRPPRRLRVVVAEKRSGSGLLRDAVKASRVTPDDCRGSREAERRLDEPYGETAMQRIPAHGMGAFRARHARS
jgi:hypothetical protein